MKRKPLAISLLIFIFLPTSIYSGGLHFGINSAIHKKVEEIKEEQVLEELEDDPPSVSITNPPDGSTVSGTVDVGANASDDNGIDRVQFLIGGVTKSTDTSSPYSYSWNTTQESNASHTVKVIAYDTAEQTATDQHTVTVSNIIGSRELPDTGQTGDYTSTWGEDSDYQPAASQPSYTDNEDGTITDNKTGLMWVQDGNSAGCNYGNTLTWEEALTFCEGLSYAGYTDWRLPNAGELGSIVDYQKGCPAINIWYFTNTYSDRYWTSTTYVPIATRAWYVYFDGGGVSGYNGTGNSYVRPVRAGPSASGYGHELPDTGQTVSYTDTWGEDSDYQPPDSQPSYTDNDNGTITDNRTGLMWVKDGNSAGCNNGSWLTWEEALTFCEGLSYAGYSDWRLPNMRELRSIVNYQNYKPAINTTYFINTESYYYWTSTTRILYTTSAWDVDFYYGEGGLGLKGFNYPVRPVRAGP